MIVLNLLQIGQSSQIFLFVSLVIVMYKENNSKTIYSVSFIYLFIYFNGFFLFLPAGKSMIGLGHLTMLRADVMVVSSSENYCQKKGQHLNLVITLNCKNLWNSFKLGSDTLIKYSSRILIEHLSQQ